MNLLLQETRWDSWPVMRRAAEMPRIQLNIPFYTWICFTHALKLI